ncbi:MAG: dihydrodipicolinate reductase C-terminal domain-containing protein [Elusimicrobiales bacterium]|jgi:4-hydroxy-tetrahydrodipicolinate reductase|nr:dihydrodipicolinate reductase C-terminal domain-containing protein [Elusimicrobiales bacterium]
MTDPVIKIAVNGGLGRMGLKVSERLALRRGACPGPIFDALPGRTSLRPEAAPAALEGCGAAIDFSSPAGAVSFAEACAAAGVPLVTGTTGFSAAQLESLRALSSRIPVFVSPNMSPAVNLTFALTRLMAEKLEGFDIHVSEVHHRLKKDAPSGTALRYLDAVRAAGREAAVSSARAGDIVGEHTVLFAGPHERVELTHRAHSRDVFADGAITAALWLAGKEKGFYDYADLLGLKGVLK